MTLQQGFMVYLIIGGLWVLLGISLRDDWKTKTQSLTVGVIAVSLAILLWPIGFLRRH